MEGLEILEEITEHMSLWLHSRIICAMLPLSPSSGDIHPNQRLRPEVFAFTFNQRKRKKTSQRESSGIGWLKEGRGEG